MHGSHTRRFSWVAVAVQATIRHHFAGFAIPAELSPHPWLGNGLAVVLQLPRCCEPGDTERLVNKLNWWEWGALESPPFVGAWTCQPGKEQPIFMTFVPDEAILGLMATSPRKP